MKIMSTKDAKNAFGMTIDTARTEPVAIEKHGRRVVVAVVEEYDRLKALEDASSGRAKRSTGEDGQQ
ncbi:type II toxin-antitoxin system prevent-host-death family antitoxin [Tistrella mobilis]|uniref:Antitoxin n=1 Tax=Tistrella mobilis TaxID=171437 RepID=A0A161QZZ1_9PROT|nr:type II toxin-antitoxin system prevent-host-death family antitoxin [Tistrella mobilis]KYO50490.1 hypothetical protein AUP44_12795 [Tistrella mobilis]